MSTSRLHQTCPKCLRSHSHTGASCFEIMKHWDKKFYYNLSTVLSILDDRKAWLGRGGYKCDSLKKFMTIRFIKRSPWTKAGCCIKTMAACQAYTVNKIEFHLKQNLQLPVEHIYIEIISLLQGWNIHSHARYYGNRHTIGGSYKFISLFGNQEKIILLCLCAIAIWQIGSYCLRKMCSHNSVTVSKLP